MKTLPGQALWLAVVLAFQASIASAEGDYWALAEDAQAASASLTTVESAPPGREGWLPTAGEPGVQLTQNVEPSPTWYLDARVQQMFDSRTSY
ncbi:MAG: hypothetical protein ABFC96_18735, partial [Thermoguttaceae bacterium]